MHTNQTHHIQGEGKNQIKDRLSITHVCCFTGFCLNAYFSWNLDIIILSFVQYRTRFCFWNVFIRMKFSILCKSIEKWKYEKKSVYNKSVSLSLTLLIYSKKKKIFTFVFLCFYRVCHILILSSLNQILLSIWRMFLN